MIVILIISFIALVEVVVAFYRSLSHIFSPLLLMFCYICLVIKRYNYET